MVTIIFFAVIGMAIALYREYKEEYNWPEFYFLNGLLGSMIGGTIGFVLAIALPNETYKKHTEFKIESMRDGSQMHGNFFLGSGRIDEAMYYTFYYQTKNGGFKMKQIKHNRAEIFYTTGTPKAVNIEEANTDSWYNVFGISLCDCDSWEIFIPEGSINHEYELDAQ